jgi:hypothetical protein
VKDMRSKVGQVQSNRDEIERSQRAVLIETTEEGVESTGLIYRILVIVVEWEAIIEVHLNSTNKIALEVKRDLAGIYSCVVVELTRW